MLIMRSQNGQGCYVCSACSPTSPPLLMHSNKSAPNDLTFPYLLYVWLLGSQLWLLQSWRWLDQMVGSAVVW